MHLPLSDPYFPDPYSNLWLREHLIPHLKRRLGPQPDAIYDRAAVLYLQTMETITQRGLNVSLTVPVLLLAALMDMGSEGLNDSAKSVSVTRALDTLRKDVERGPTQGEF